MRAAMALMTVWLATCLGPSSHAGEPATRPAEAPTTQSSSELLKDVQRKMESLKTVQGEFVQEKNLAIFKRTLTIRGRFAVERPRRLVWHVTEPMKYSIRVENDEVRSWDEDTNHVERIRIGPTHSFRAAFEQFQGWFLGSYASLEQAYEVMVESRDPLKVRFHPKASSPMAQMIKRVDVTFQADHLYLDTLVIHEGSGDTTTIRFMKTVLNRPVPDETWEIPPHGR